MKLGVSPESLSPSATDRHSAVSSRKGVDSVHVSALVSHIYCQWPTTCRHHSHQAKDITHCKPLKYIAKRFHIYSFFYHIYYKNMTDSDRIWYMVSWINLLLCNVNFSTSPESCTLFCEKFIQYTICQILSESVEFHRKGDKKTFWCVFFTIHSIVNVT